jgi:hypothetical protein
MYSTQLSRQSSVNSNDPMFKENIILTDRHRAFSLLLHSVTVQANTISGYSHKFDSLITFNLDNKDFNVLQAKLRKLPRYIKRCNTCHEGNGTNSGLMQ